MKEIYSFEKGAIPWLPNPHDCVIKEILRKDGCVEFRFEDGISVHDSVQAQAPGAKSLIIRYRLWDDGDDCFSVYRCELPKRPFRRKTRYTELDQSRLAELPMGKMPLEYLQHYVATFRILVVLSTAVFTADVREVEYEWIF